jgi:hypothetical protein
MKNFVASLALAATAAIVAAVPAQAYTYISVLDQSDGHGIGPFGQVALTEAGDNKTVNVVVTLFAPEKAFLNTGGKHDPFLFNLTGNYAVTVGPNLPGQTFKNGGYDSTGTKFEATPFGFFTNKIACCLNTNGTEKNGASAASLPPIKFSVYNANGLTVAGVGATYDQFGKLLTLGTGAHFKSNLGGSWFAADLVDNNGRTFNVAARDMTVPGGIPEAATWTMMLLGFGFVGGSLRRKKLSMRYA